VAPAADLLAIEFLSKAFGSVRAVDDVSLTVRAGEFLSLLGPSGCGKTSLLRLIAGLERPTAGTIRLDGARINEVPPHRRQIGLVVQNYALFPHLTVFENVAYGLRVRRLAEAEIRRRVREALALVRLADFDKRLPRQLSGGQQQRCALARAFVIEPRLLLLDEALGALDKKLREEMQVELKQLQRTLGVTAIHVTHDQEEALGMSDRIVVLNHGRIEQIDTPRGLYDRPRTEFVASFIGEANMFRARVEGRGDAGTVLARTEDGLALAVPDDGGRLAGAELTVVVRPEYARLDDGMPADAVNAVAGTVDAVVYQGSSTKIVLRTDAGRTLVVYEPNSLARGDGDGPLGGRRRVSWPAAAAHVLDG
jgi:spermidine/putrescine ABC transporter ATP-binding subunit